MPKARSWPCTWGRSEEPVPGAWEPSAPLHSSATQESSDVHAMPRVSGGTWDSVLIY